MARQKPKSVIYSSSINAGPDPIGGEMYYATLTAQADAMPARQVGASIGHSDRSLIERFTALWNAGAFPVVIEETNDTSLPARLDTEAPLPHPRYNFAAAVAGTEARLGIRYEDVKNVKIELKNIKVHKALSQETIAFSATLYVDSKKAAEISNHGTGGCNETRAYDNGLVARAEAYAYFLGHDIEPLDSLVNDIVADEEERKTILRQCKTKTVFRLPSEPNGRYYTSDLPYSLKSIDHVRKDHPDAIFFNETIASQKPATEDPIEPHILRAMKKNVVFKPDKSRPEMRQLPGAYTVAARERILKQFPKAEILNESLLKQKPTA